MTTEPVPASVTPVEELGFEQAQAELEAIVERLEDPRTGLDDALDLWERGEALHAVCQARLDRAAARIRRLQASPDEVADVVAESTSGDFEPQPPVDGDEAPGDPAEPENLF